MPRNRDTAKSNPAETPTESGTSPGASAAAASSRPKDDTLSSLTNGIGTEPPAASDDHDATVDQPASEPKESPAGTASLQEPDTVAASDKKKPTRNRSRKAEANGDKASPVKEVRNGEQQQLAKTQHVVSPTVSTSASIKERNDASKTSIKEKAQPRATQPKAERRPAVVKENTGTNGSSSSSRSDEEPSKKKRVRSKPADASSKDDDAPARKRGRPRKTPLPPKNGASKDPLPNGGASQGNTAASSNGRGRPKKSEPLPQSNVRISLPSNLMPTSPAGTMGVCRVMIDISGNVLLEPTVDSVTVRPVNAGEGRVLPPNSRLIHLTIRAPHEKW